MKILVVDDEALLVKGIRFNLQNEGHEVLTASDGLEALQLCKEQAPDLIVMDVMMPRLDGFSACKEIRKIKNTPILMLSARTEEYDNWLIKRMVLDKTLVEQDREKFTDGRDRFLRDHNIEYYFKKFVEE